MFPSALPAALAYVALSVVFTWPLAAGIGSDVPGDLGDSLLNMWILAWSAEHMPQLLTGGISWTQYWNGNIFHPDPLALALSEHLFGQALQILPVYWLSGNIILCYNLLFISTFALSAFGAYLLVRDLTGDRRAAFIAGLVYGFLPYRIASVPHLQVLSSQWMPFALWGLNRFVVEGAAPGSRIPAMRALVVAVGALTMQNWSCGYYLLYFAPFVPLFVLHRMWTAGVIRDLKVWLALVGAAAITLALTLPFLFPYQRAQALFEIERPFVEVIRFSASLWSYVTAAENVRLYGSILRFHSGPEGETFLGFIPWILAFTAIGMLIRRAKTAPEQPPAAHASRSILSKAFMGLLVVLAVTQLVALIAVVLFGGFDMTFIGVQIRARTPLRLVMQLVAVVGLLLALSPRMRERAARLSRSPVMLCGALTILAIWLSFGPMPHIGETRNSGYGLYRALFDYVPGFNGVRVPARYAMIAGLFLAMLAGYGARFLASRFSFVVALSILVLAEGAAIPFEINRTWRQEQATPPARVMPRAEAPAVYRAIASLPADAVISEFPYGDGAWEIRYVYYAAAHWRRITNGYSGGFPTSYRERAARLRRVHLDPEAAWQSLRGAGTTHVVVHRNAFAALADADLVEAWLRTRGAIELARFEDGDMLFALDF